MQCTWLGFARVGILVKLRHFLEKVKDEDGAYNHLQASLRMFMDLDLINKFNIDYLTLCRSQNSLTKILNPQIDRWHNPFSDGCAQWRKTTGRWTTTTGDTPSTSASWCSPSSPPPRGGTTLARLRYLPGFSRACFEVVFQNRCWRWW